MSLERSGSDGQPLDPAMFRQVLSTFPAGVVILTATGEDDKGSGLTITAFCSVSAEPALVLACVDKGSNTLPAIRGSQAFTINILAAGRHETAMTFASKREDKFEGVTWQPPSVPNGGPILSDDAASYVACRVEREIEGGDHQIFIGEVVEAGVQDGHPPLLYHNRGFASLAETP